MVVDFAFAEARRRMALIRAMISRACTGLRTTSSAPAAKSLRVDSRPVVSFSAMAGASLRVLMTLVTISRQSKSPRMKASTAARSGPLVEWNQLSKSVGVKLAVEKPSRPKLAW